ncbi:MAG: hypothetical protein MUC69_05440 [Gemmatimonadales bacterium]|jgi:hypothetical protein|nr:hypothetical protein [Gemmatimonadales bacterium]
MPPRPIRPALVAALLLALAAPLPGQQPDCARPTSDETLDSAYIAEVEEARGPPKVLHAEPIYIDLFRDLGARRGEAEWNAAFGLTDNLDYDAYEMLVEYEFVPVDRLGLEVELPATLYRGRGGSGAVPSDRIESLKFGAQWTFLVSTEAATSLALGYLNELKFADLDRWGDDPLFKGNKFNPFIVAAKRWGRNIHTLLYTGPSQTVIFDGPDEPFVWEANWNFHYMLPGTRNFLGVELNQRFLKDDFDMVIRPQMRIGLDEHFLIGIATGIPVDRRDEGLGIFVRVIWEPGHALPDAVVKH